MAVAPVADPAPPTDIAPPLRLTLGKSSLLRVPEDVTRVSVGNPEIADVILINPRELYLLGRKIGPTNVFLWAKGGRTTIMDVSVSIDTEALQDKLGLLMPGEKKITVSAAGESLVLTGLVSDAVKVQRAVSLAEQFGGKKVINMLGTGDAAQVMLEVKVAEVSKTLIDKLGASFTGARTIGSFTYSLITNLLTGSAGAASLTRAGGATAFSLDAQIQNGLIKILAEPTIMATSGQEGAFLAGGKIFIPVPQAGGAGGVGDHAAGRNVRGRAQVHADGPRGRAHQSASHPRGIGALTGGDALHHGKWRSQRAADDHHPARVDHGAAV